MRWYYTGLLQFVQTECVWRDATHNHHQLVVELLLALASVHYLAANG